MKLNSDHKTTVFGALGAAVIAANANPEQVLQGDMQEISKLLVAGLVALWSYFTNKK